MKVEHITFRGGSMIRDTKDIDPVTRKFFKPLQAGSITHKIDYTPFTCKITVDKGIAVFNLFAQGSLICTNICCFAKEDKKTALLYAKGITDRIDKNCILTNPGQDCFMITILIDPLTAIHDLGIAGEIELYIYDAIYQGLQKQASISQNTKDSSSDSSRTNFHKFEIGKPFPWKKYIGLGDATIPVFNAASFDVIISLTQPSPEEIKIFKKGTLKTGLFNYKNIPFLYFDFCQYSLDVSLNINKLTDTETNNWLNAESNIVNLFLIDGHTGILHAQRIISIDFMENIRDILEAQTEQTVEETEQLITEATLKYTAKDIQQQAIKNMVFHR